MTNSITATTVHSAEMARLVEIMVRWPWLLDAMGARRTIGTRQTTVLAELVRACSSSQLWRDAATAAHLDIGDEAMIDLRELLGRPGTDSEVLIAIAGRYL